MLTVAKLAPLKDRDPYLYETLVKIVSSVNATRRLGTLLPALSSFRFQRPGPWLGD